VKRRNFNKIIQTCVYKSVAKYRLYTYISILLHKRTRIGVESTEHWYSYRNENRYSMCCGLFGFWKHFVLSEFYEEMDRKHQFKRKSELASVMREKRRRERRGMSYAMSK